MRGDTTEEEDEEEDMAMVVAVVIIQLSWALEGAYKNSFIHTTCTKSNILNILLTSHSFTTHYRIIIRSYRIFKMKNRSRKELFV